MLPIYERLVRVASGLVIGNAFFSVRSRTVVREERDSNGACYETIRDVGVGWVVGRCEIDFCFWLGTLRPNSAKLAS